MNYIDSLNTSDTSDESSIFTNNCFEDISSIQSISMSSSFAVLPSGPSIFQQPIRYTQEPVESAPASDLYQENQMLKRKIQDLEKSLKIQLPATEDPYAYKSKSWIRSNTQYFTDSHNDSCLKSLSEEFDAACEAGPVKRSRTFGSDKDPQKFLKLAMMKSIGTLKF
jgi:hypothetical protein